MNAMVFYMSLDIPRHLNTEKEFGPPCTQKNTKPQEVFGCLGDVFKDFLFSPRKLGK